MNGLTKQEYRKPEITELSVAIVTNGMASNKADVGGESGSMMTSTS